MNTSYPKALRAKIATFPDKPGIYFFKDARRDVVYIGKARSLKNRVKSYFSSTSDMKVHNILDETIDIDYLLTDSEKEASFLENNFIQQYQPKFNIRLKDDKSFPYLKVIQYESFPRISLTRRVEADGARYFGPFSPAHQARKTIHILNKYFGIRGCHETIPGNRRRPCLEYDLKLCSAPCVGRITESEYREQLHNALLFLEGHNQELARILTRRMNQASEDQDFEQAAHLRDLIKAVKQSQDKPRVISIQQENKDIFGLAVEKNEALLHVFLMRRGKVIESQSLFRRGLKVTAAEEILSRLTNEFYAGRHDLPGKVILPYSPPDAAALGEDLSRRRGKKVTVLAPRKGKNRELVKLVNRNAVSLLRLRRTEVSPLDELKRLLELKAVPVHIEGFDISNTSGLESVGSCVHFTLGQPDKDEYRRFRVKTVTGPNDTASLHEVVQRRYRRRLRENLTLPDLVLIDGGKGQLQAAREALAECGLPHIPVVALAKKEELLFSSRTPHGLRLERTSPALKLLQNIRDEAHRFALNLHRRLRSRESFSSLLDDVPGIGKKRKKILLQAYGTMLNIQAAPESDLARIVGKRAAAELKK